jgi:hypothetical protein
MIILKILMTYLAETKLGRVGEIFYFFDKKHLRKRNSSLPPQ